MQGVEKQTRLETRGWFQRELARLGLERQHRTLAGLLPRLQLLGLLAVRQDHHVLVQHRRHAEAVLADHRSEVQVPNVLAVVIQGQQGQPVGRGPSDVDALGVDGRRATAEGVPGVDAMRLGFVLPPPEFAPVGGRQAEDDSGSRSRHPRSSGRSCLPTAPATSGLDRATPLSSGSPLRSISRASSSRGSGPCRWDRENASTPGRAYWQTGWIAGRGGRSGSTEKNAWQVASWLAGMRAQTYRIQNWRSCLSAIVGRSARQF